MSPINFPRQIPLHGSDVLPHGRNEKRTFKALGSAIDTRDLPVASFQFAEQPLFYRAPQCPRGSVRVFNQRCPKATADNSRISVAVHCYVRTPVLEIHEQWMVSWEHEDEALAADVLRCVKNGVCRVDADDLNEIYLATSDGSMRRLAKSCRLSLILSGVEELWAVQFVLS
jgi:hypothetical protein